MATSRWRDADIEAAFDASVVTDIKDHVAKMYEDEQVKNGLDFKEPPSMLVCFSAEDVKAWTKPAEADLPGGYQRVGPKLKPGVTVCKFKIGSISYDGLDHVAGKWVFIPKPFRAIKGE